MAKSIIPKRGVYAIQCDDGRAYVGSSRNLTQRWLCHRSALRIGRHQNGLLQTAWNQLGENHFRFVVLEETSDDDLLAAEQRWMDDLQSALVGFNRSPTAGSNTGVVHTAETCEKVSAALKGRTFSQETRMRISAAKRGVKKSPEDRARMSLARAGEGSNSAKVTEADVREIRRRVAAGELQRVVAAVYGLSPGSVSAIVRRTKWRYVV